MGMGRVGTAVAVLLLSGCAARKANAPDKRAKAERRYVDPALGLEVVRPQGAWELQVSEARGPEGLAGPLLLRDRETGTQVVIQVAPAVATPTQFAERLSEGLRGYPGLTTGDPEPLRLRENAVGFGFSMGESVRGKVAVMEGGEGQVFLLMATWPTAIPQIEQGGVDEIFAKVKSIPKAP